ncbi:MAG: 23S rRNA (uracil(1939)-C(5))-methyltransferase RlmD [Patescibacteria group bacterium]|jgi:23S rRNA (uracil1939-C5)-methyltransferase
MSKNQILKIEKLINEGWGMGHDERGKAVFVKKSVPGDLLEVKINRKKKSYAEAVLENVIEPSDSRINPPCPFFDACGGCEHQNIAYTDQLKFKEELFTETLQRARIETKPEKIIPGSESDRYYRNSIRFFFLEDKEKRISFARHHYIHENGLTAVNSCLLQSETCNEILDTLQSHINLHVEKKSSFWQLKIREGKFTNEFMVEIITSGEELPDREGIVGALTQIDGIKSIYHTIAPAKSLRNLRRRIIFGSPVIHEKIGSFTFQISPESFFQTNSLGVKTLYDTINKYAAITPKDVLLDLYCGTGTIGIYLSTLAKSVIGVESIPAAIRDAKDNARVNKVGNCDFICTDAEEFVCGLSAHPSTLPSPPSTIILDPPRAGLTPKLINSLSKLTPFALRLIYVSCNPSTFARDIKLFQEQGIALKKVQPIDMFPHTHHLECVGLLTKK